MLPGWTKAESVFRFRLNPAYVLILPKSVCYADIFPDSEDIRSMYDVSFEVSNPGMTACFRYVRSGTFLR